MNRIVIPLNIESISTVDATNLATALTLVNDLKTNYNYLVDNYNQLLREMRLGGYNI